MNRPGSRIARLLCDSAAKFTTTSTSWSSSAATIAGPSPMSACTKTTRSPSSTSARFGRFPAYVSRSTATTRSSGWVGRQWRTKFEPMKPAAPVTRIVDIGAVYGGRGLRRLSRRAPHASPGLWPSTRGVEPWPRSSRSVDGAETTLPLPWTPRQSAPMTRTTSTSVHRRVLDQLADATEVPGDQLGLGERARGVAHERLGRWRARCRRRPGPKPRSCSRAIVLPASPAFVEPLSTVDDRVGLA